MKLNTLFLINAIIAIVFALGFLLAPGVLMSTFTEAPLGEFGTIFARAFGAALVGNAVLLWLARGVSDIDGRRNIAIAFLVYNVIQTVVITQAQLSVPLNALGWSNPGHLALLGLGYAYFLFVKRDFS